MKSKLPNFRGKAVSVVLTGDDEHRLLFDPLFEMQGGRLFLIGTIPRHGSTKDWVAQLPAGVAWDMVQEYIVFDSVEHYARRLAIYEGKRKRKA